MPPACICRPVPGCRHDRWLTAGLCRTAGPDRASDAAGPVVAAAIDPAAAAASSSFPPTRLLLQIAPREETPSRTPWWLTLLRLMLAGARHHRRSRTALASAAGRDENQRAGRNPDRRRLGGRCHLGCAHADRRRYYSACGRRPPRRWRWYRCPKGRMTFRWSRRIRHACACTDSAQCPIRSTAPTRCRR